MMGYPESTGAVTTTWSKVSGPGTVTLGTRRGEHHGELQRSGELCVAADGQ